MYLIWTIINAAFIILFFALVLSFFTKGKQLFDTKYGNVIIVILVIGIIGLINGKVNNSKNEYAFPTNNEFEGRYIKQIRTVIEDNALFDIALLVRLQKNSEGELIPIFSRSRVSGFSSGHEWNYDFAEIDKIDDNTYSYTVFGILDWHLFGIKLYGQPKEITGTFTIEE